MNCTPTQKTSALFKLDVLLTSSESRNSANRVSAEEPQMHAPDSSSWEISCVTVQPPGAVCMYVVV